MSGQVPVIQALRAFAALAIALHHALHEADVLGQRIGAGTSLQAKAPFLLAGVDLFFVISGFVMVYASRDVFGSTNRAWPFLKRRLARIIPIYWTLTVAYLVLLLGGLAPLNRAKPDGWEIAASFLFIPYPKAGGPLIQPVYDLGWTLNYEMFFYLIFAAALGLKRHVAVPAVAGALLVFASAGVFISPDTPQLYFWSRSIILEFALGMIIAHMALTGVKPTRPLAAVLTAASIALFALGMMKPGLLPDRLLLYGLPCALLVLASLAFDTVPFGGPFARLLVKLGDASYALYLIHPFVFRGLAVIAGATLAGLSPWLFITIALGLACPLSYAIWKWFERPVTKALQGSKTR